VRKRPPWLAVLVALAAASAIAADFDVSWMNPAEPVSDPQGLLDMDGRDRLREALSTCAVDYGVPLRVVALPALANLGAPDLQPDTAAALLLEAAQRDLGEGHAGDHDRALLLLLLHKEATIHLALGSAWDGRFFTAGRKIAREAQESIGPDTPPEAALVAAAENIVELVRASQQSTGISPSWYGAAIAAVLLLLAAGLFAVWRHYRKRAVSGLQEAVQERANTVIRQKLKRGADPDAYDEHGYTAAMHAATQGDLQTLQVLHEYGADLGRPTRQGETPLYTAVQHGHAGVAAFLLSKGVPVDPVTVHNETPLLIAAREGHLEIVAGLLHSGANVNQQDNRGWSALMIALREKHDKVVSLLLNHNVDVNLAPKDGANAVMMAVKQENEALVRRLIDQGADVHHQARDGMCALRIAVLRGNLEIARRLLNAGADVSAPFANKETPAEMAERQGHGELAAYLQKREKRLAACMDILEVVARGDMERLREIVAQVPRSVNVHSRRSRWTPLLIAVRAAHGEMVELLLAHGADVHARSSEGKAAIAYAVDAGDLAMVKVLLEGGARIDQIDGEGTDLKAYAAARGQKQIMAFTDSFAAQQAAGYALFQAVKDDDPPRALALLKENPGCVDARTRHERWTPLLQAARGANASMAKLLVEYGAQVNLCNSRGMSPLMYAARSGDLQLVRLLLNCGADVRAVSREGNTACEFALDRGHARVVMLLQEVESQLTDLSRAGFPGESKADTGQGENGRALDVFQAVQEGDMRRLKQVLHYWPGSVRLRWGPSELTPLHMAVNAGNFQAAQLLVGAGADVNAPTREGRMPLHQAVGRADLALAELLVAHGANVDALSQGQTPIQAAATAGYEDIVEVLVRTRSDSGA